MPKLLRFNNKIYKESAIKKAISAYSDFAKFSLIKDNKYIKVKVDKINPDVGNIITDEFTNFVLGVTKNDFRA